MSYKDEIEKYQKNRYEFLKVNTESPLDDEEKEGFKELHFFPIDEKYRLTGSMNLYPTLKPGRVKPNEPGVILMKFGKLKISIDDQSVTVIIHKVENEDQYMLFFRDGTSGKGSYGMGRFVEVEKIDEKSYVIDFNKAYNPNCAYSNRYTCPLAPKKNHLDVEIAAGEKNYHD